MSSEKHKRDSRLYYWQHHEQCLLRCRERHQHLKHPCVDCGKLCSARAKRCKSCSCIYWWKPKKNKQKLCIDCGKFIWQKATRCKSCAHKGNRNKNWKGGRHISNLGYIFIRNPTHPRADKKGYVLEHILIWEQAHNKPLPKGWVIHHLNGIKDDNRHGNLVALPDKKHRQILQAKAKRIQELEALLNHQNQLF